MIKLLWNARHRKQSKKQMDNVALSLNKSDACFAWNMNILQHSISEYNTCVCNHKTQCMFEIMFIATLKLFLVGEKIEMMM